jgi:hypothetical protein
MAIRSGLGGQFGFAPEVTYGTYVAPTKWAEVVKADLKKDTTFVQGGGVAAGRLQRLGSRRNIGATKASGSLEMEVPNKGIGLLLQALMGTTVTPVLQNTSTGYLQTHTLADPYDKMLTMQAGLPDIGTGTSRPYSFLGCKVLGAEFSCAIGEQLMSEWTIDARQMTEAQSLVAPSYATTLDGFDFTQSTVKLGATVGVAASVDGIRSINVNIQRASRTDRTYHGNGGLQSQPIINDWQTISGTITADFLDKTVFVDRYHNNTQFALVWEFVGTSLGGTPEIFETFRITLPGCFFDGDTPTLDGPDIISGSFPFVWQHDGTTYPKIEYISTDTTL